MLTAAAASGSIPACAGEALPGQWAYEWGLVYPRVCGGSAVCRIVVVQFDGLSPRVRGKRIPPSTPAQCRRSIPACAGEAAAPLRASMQAPVYPRVCGGSVASASSPASREGLSPRVRGKLTI